MVPGYLCILFLFIFCILWATGWKPIFAPNVRTGWALTLTGLILCTLMVPIWITPIAKFPGFHIHASVCLLLVSSVTAVLLSAKHGQAFFLVLCAVMLAVVWGSTRSLYAHESFLHWLSPTLDAPLLAGLLCGVFTTDSNHQLAIMAWGAAIGECMAALLQEGGTFQVQIGSWAWWDGFAIAICATFALGAAGRALRGMISKLGAVWLQQRGGRSS